MAMTIKDIREKYPQYASKTDSELADAIHSKYYSSLPKQQVYAKLGLDSEVEDEAEMGGSQPQESTGFSGLARDAISGLGKALSSGLKFAIRAPKNIQEIGTELIKHPLSSPPHIAQQILAGLGEGAKGALNIPHEIFEELANKKITPNWLRTGKIPEDTGVEKFLGLEPTKKSDELLRALPALYGGGQLAAKGIGKVKEIAKAPSKEMLFQRALEDRLGEVAEKTDISKADLKKLQEALKLDYSTIHPEKLGEANPVSLQESINIKKQKLAEKQPLTEIPEQKIGEIPSEPDTKAIIAEKKAAAESARKAAEETLGVLDNPRLKGGAIVQKAIKDVKKSSSDLYDQARNHYVEKKIMADNSKEIKAVTDDLSALKDADELAPGYGSGTAEQKALENQIASLKGEQVNASDIFDLQRTLEKMAQDTRKKQYSGVSELDFKRLGNLAERFDSHANNLAKRLEAVGGKDVQGMIKEANKGWKTFKDLEKNNVGKAALNKGELPSRAMIDIANTQSGNEFLRALTETYPELKKHMLAAHVGEGSVNKLLKPTTLTKEYLKALPEVEDKVQDLKNAIAGIKEGEAKASNVKKEYDALVTSMKDAAKQQKIRQDAIEESDALKKQIKFKEDALPKIQAKMQEVEKNSAEYSKLKNELEDHKKFIKDKGGRLKELATFFVKVKGANMLRF